MALLCPVPHLSPCPLHGFKAHKEARNAVHRYQPRSKNAMVAYIGRSGFDNYMELDMEQSFNRMSRMMDRQMEDSLQSFDQLSRSIDRQVQEAVRDGSRNIVISQSEIRSSNSYSYHRSVQVSGGGGPMTPAKPTPAPSFFSALLIAAAVLAAAYAAVAAAFARNYELTSFRDSNKWQLVLLWPLLVLFSSNFRQQFWAAVKGEAPPPLKERAQDYQ